MKFVVAVVMLALAAGVQSSLIPYAAQIAPAVSYVSSVAHPGPLLGGHGGWGPAAISVDGGWGHGGLLGIPGISLSQGPIGLGHGLGLGLGRGIGLGHGLGLGLGLGHGAGLGLGHGLGHGHEGVYVAKTLGAVHTAPLAGHINSATSLNVAAAPGTIGSIH